MSQILSEWKRFLHINTCPLFQNREGIGFRPFGSDAGFREGDDGFRIDKVDERVADTGQTPLARKDTKEVLASILKVNAEVQEIICPSIRDINVLHKHLLPPSAKETPGKERWPGE